MEPRPRADSPPTVLAGTADPDLRAALLAASAAADVRVEPVTDLAELRRGWAAARAVLVGIDLAEVAMDAALPRRAALYVVGDERSAEQVCHAALHLGGAPVVVPASAGWLAGELAGLVRAPGAGGSLVALVGASGGLGTSTLATAVAVVAAREGEAVLLVDLDPLSGGIDLLLGAERAPGWRWAELAGARGHLGELPGRLVSVAGLDVLAMPRGRPFVPAGAAVEAVLRAARRDYSLVVLDAGRSADPVARAALAAADTTLVAVAATVPGVAAAWSTTERLAAAPNPLIPSGLIVRRPRRAGLRTAEVATSLGLAVLAEVRDDPGAATAAERGDPPGRARRTPVRRAAERVVATVLGAAARIEGPA